MFLLEKIESGDDLISSLESKESENFDDAYIKGTRYLDSYTFHLANEWKSTSGDFFHDFLTLDRPFRLNDNIKAKYDKDPMPKEMMVITETDL